MTLAEDTILEKRYRIDRLLAHAGTRATYRGFDLNLKMPVLIKENSLDTTQKLNQFKQEALILTGLRHRALPWVIHHFSQANHQYLVLDFVDSQSVWDLIQEQGNPLPEKQALDTMVRICKAVSHLHQQSPPIIHNDITPHNIKFSGNQEPVLVGFGIAKQGESNIQIDPESARSGYVAPERFSGRTVTPVSDVYSLGATLYSLVTGLEPPNSLSNVKMKPPQSVTPTLNDLTVKAITQAMQPKPADRPPSVSVWLKELEYVLKSMTSTAPRPSPAWTPVASAQDTINLTAYQADHPNFWLVDPTGLGYILGPEPLLIGRSPDSDIVVDDSGVSLSHTYVRADGQTCLVMDIDTTNGTFLNNHRLGSGWYPLNPGDILVVGPTRFHLTNIQPVRMAPKRKKSQPPVAAAAERQAGASQTPASTPASTKENQGQRRLLGVIIALLFIMGVGIVAYFWLTATAPSEVNLPTPTTAAATTTEAAVAPDTTAESIAQLQSSPAEADQQPEEPTTSDEAVGAARQEPTAAITGTQTATASLAATATVTPTAIAGRPAASPTPTGPTPIPLEAATTVESLGTVEIIDIDINPQNPQEVYALVKGDGIYKSVSGGAGPWAKMGLDANGVAAFVIDPSNPARLYAPTWNAVLKSTDGGNSWTANSQGLQGNQTVNVLTINPADPDILYAGAGENLVVSTDGGQRWTSLGYGEGLGVGKLHSIVVDPFNPTTLYVAGLAGSIYKSTDGGNTFSQLPDNVGQGAYSLVAHPTQPDTLLTGVNSAEAAILKTENGRDFNTISAGLVFGGADSPYNALAISPSNPNVIYAGTGLEDNRLAKGLFKSRDGGQSWSSISGDLPRNPETGQPYYVKSITIHPTNPDIVFAATGNGLYQSRDGGQSWALR